MDKISNIKNFLNEKLINPIMNKIKKEEDIKPIDFKDIRVMLTSLNNDGTWKANICLPQYLSNLPPYTWWQLEVPLMRAYGKVELLKDDVRYIDLPKKMMLYNVKFKFIPDNDKCKYYKCNDYRAAYVKVPKDVDDLPLVDKNRKSKIEKYILEKLSKKYKTNIELIKVSWRNDPVYFDHYLAVYRVHNHKD
jgi:hypothetical protein